MNPEIYAQSQIFGQIQHFGPLFFWKKVCKNSRVDDCSWQSNAIGSALEMWGLGASFEGYYTFVRNLNAVVREVKEQIQL